MAHDIFICHSSEDKATADKACAALEAEGVKCWIAPRDVVPGSVWAASITSAIKNNRLILLIYSRYANDSMQVLRELELATSNNSLILPLRIEYTAPTDAIAYYIGAAHWLDAFSPAQVEKHLSKLTNAVRQHLGISHESTLERKKKYKGAIEYRPLEVFQDTLKSGRLGPKMVVLPAGSFLMGSTKETDADERSDDEHPHQVAIEKPFAIGQYPVTNAQYRQFNPDHDSSDYQGHSLNSDDQPVVYVSWHDAVAYTKWLKE